MNEASFAACTALVRRADPDRYFSGLLAPADKRPFLMALYALNYELAHVADSIREPSLGAIRLQWWREALAEGREMTPRRHDVVEAMATVISSCELPSEYLERMIDARGFDVSPEEFADYEALEGYLDATSATLMRLAAWILDDRGRHDLTATHAGIAYGLTGIARSLVSAAQRGKSLVPVGALEAAGLSRDQLSSPSNREALASIAREMAARAQERHHGAHIRAGEEIPFAAFLPAALVPLYVRRIRAPSFDPAKPDVGLHWRIAALAKASLRGRI
jgi:15-cis-phytoene synthase